MYIRTYMYVKGKAIEWYSAILNKPGPVVAINYGSAYNSTICEFSEKLLTTSSYASLYN